MRALARSRPKDIPVVHRRLARVLLVVVGVAWACGAGDEAALLAWDEVTASITLRLRGRW